jgi:cell division protein FtsZ
MVELLSEEGIYEFDMEMLSHIFDLDIAKTMVVTCSADGENAIETLLNNATELLKTKLPDPGIRIDRLLISIIGGEDLAVGDVKRINQTISETFTDPGKIFYGANIRKDAEGTLDLVVYLSMHLGKQFELVDLSRSESPEVLVSTKTTRKKKKPAKKTKRGSQPTATDEGQTMLDSILSDSNRGYFENTGQNDWNGVDLDIPTYIRRGLRIRS